MEIQVAKEDSLEEVTADVCDVDMDTMVNLLVQDMTELSADPISDTDSAVKTQTSNDAVQLWIN